MLGRGQGGVLRALRALSRAVPVEARIFLRGLVGYNAYDPEAQAAMRHLIRPGDTVFDVGANIGELTTVMSRLAAPASGYPSGRVYAFEANPACLPRLSRMLRLSRVRNCTIVLGAVTDRADQPVRLYSDDRPGTSHKMTSADPAWLPPGSPSRQIEARPIVLDDFCRRRGLRPSFVKIDVEGAETAVLRGFRNYLAASRPHLILEAGSEGAADGTGPLPLLESLGYRFAVPYPWRWVTACDFARVEQFETCIVAIHAEHVPSIDWVRHHDQPIPPRARTRLG